MYVASGFVECLQLRVVFGKKCCDDLWVTALEALSELSLIHI